jgi:glycosyltransferase involved in cell wall biosynthesis
MIVRNEEEVLARCLDCVAGIADEIVIVDTGSTDGTKEVAERYTERIYDFEWIDDFSAARNYAFSLATMDFILWLDADDIFPGEEQEKLILLKRQLAPFVDGVMMKYCSAPEADGSCVLSYYRERLLNRSRNFQWREPVHEYIPLSGHVITTEITVVHKKEKGGNPRRNLQIYEKFLENGGVLSDRSLFYYSRELYYAGRYPEAIKGFWAFLAKEEGWKEDKISACLHLSDSCRHAGDEKGRLDSLLTSFRYDLPRADCCCGIGTYYMDRQDYKRAAFWFETALRLEKPKDSWGFLYHDYWDFIPALQLCVCHHKLGNLREALKYHELTCSIKPDHPSVLYNRNYFDGVLRSGASDSGGDNGQKNGIGPAGDLPKERLPEEAI